MNTLTPFQDTDGNPVTVGDRIIILCDHNFSFRNGREAIVIWNQRYGQYEFTYNGVRRGKTYTTVDDFAGIHSFRKIIKP